MHWGCALGHTYTTSALAALAVRPEGKGLLVFMCLVLSIGATDCLKRLVSEVTGSELECADLVAKIKITWLHEIVMSLLHIGELVMC